MPVEPSTSSIHDSKPLLFVHGKDKSNANLKPSENCALEQENGAKQSQMPVEPSTSSIYDLQPLLVVDSKGKSNDDLKPSENDVLERENGTKQPQMPVEPSTYSIHYLQPLLVVDSKGKSNANLKPSENCVLERENRTKQPQMPAEPSTSLIHDLNLKPLLVVHSKGKSNANLKPSENDVLERENGTNHPQMPVEPSTSSIHDLKPLLVVHNKGKINANSKPSENDVLERENGTKQPQMPAESSISSIHDLTPLLVVNSKDKMNANLKPCRGGVLERENGEKRPQVPLKPFVSFEHPLDPNRPLTLGEYKKIQDISRKFPPPRIDLGIDGFGPDKTYKKRRTNYSPMNKLHLKKTDTPSGKLKPAVCPARRNISETAGKEKVGTWPAQKFSTQQTEGSIMANKRQCKTQVTAGQHKGIFRPVPQSSMDEYRRNFPPVAESHKHDKPGTSKTESNVNTNRTTLHKDKIVSIGARRASVPNFSVASIGSESSTLSKKLKKSISHIDPVSRPKEDTKIDPVDRKDRNVGDKTCVKAIAPKSQNKESKDMKAMKKPKDNPRDNNKFFNNKFIKLGNKPKENSVRSSKVAHGAMKIHEKKLTDSNETKKSENLKETNEKPDTLKINVTNATDACGKKISCIPENVALQPQLILNRIDDKIPISVARKRPITFASISEFVFIRCEVLLQERFPMRQKARSLPVDEECCDKAVLLDSPDVQRSTTFVRPTTMPPGVEIETTDDIIEVKPQIPIVDLTDDDVEVKKELSASPKVEDLEKEAKSDVLLKDTVIVPVQETITLYRSEETLNNSLELQATVASISSSLGVSGNTKHKMETDRVSQNEKGTNGFIPASSIVNSLVTIQDVNATVPTQTPAVTSNPSLPLLPTTCNTAVSSPRSSKSILNELANVVDAVTTRRKEPQRSEGTASIVHSVGTFLPPVYHALSQGQANAQHVRSTIIYVPPKPDAAKITRTDRNTDGVFAMPPPPYPALSKPTPRLQQEVIQRPVVDDNDHHTPMVIPTAPRSAESSSIASNKPQGPAITVTDRGGFAGGRIGDSNTNHLTPVQNARRDSNALLVTQNPQPFGSDIVKVSQVSAAQSLPCSSGGATQAGNPSTSANPPVLTPWPPTIEIPEIGKHLSRFICIYMALRRAQLQYVADFIKISKFVPDAGKTILRDFDVWTSNKVHDVLKRMSASLCGLNFSKIPVTAYSASLVIQCALESLKEAVPSITKSALYLMLDALMSPEMEQYNLVPFLRTFCVFVRDVANQMRMNANDGNSSQQQRQNLPQEPLLPAQRQLLLSQIQQYNVIIARQTIMTAPEQEVRNSIARMMQSQRQQTVNVRPSMPMQPQFASHTVGNKPPSGNLADTANQRTRERNQIRAQKAKPPRSVFQSPSSNSQNPEMLRRSCCETSHAILSNMLTNSCEPSGQVPPALPSNQAIPGKDVARPEALEERFKIHLPYTVPYEVPTSSATSIATCNNASAAAMAAASFVATAAAATAAASAVANGCASGYRCGSAVHGGARGHPERPSDS
ncbi:hypothetical protein NQ318_022349 [Aromia moschata]|uniref:Uncharacterized protein n=1 Tax=Aromia moschata TaxID=1265417 RepID=A0AAV8Z770_9CUCU|nr:hypothetical protein NQ318_022349 [Aromia moschata]